MRHSTRKKFGSTLGLASYYLRFLQAFANKAKTFNETTIQQDQIYMVRGDADYT